MIIDGKEVNIDYKAAQNIQSKIDMQQAIPETAKVELPKKDIKELTNSFEQGGEYNQSSMLGDMYDQNNNTLITGVNSEDNRSDYYQTFEDMDDCPFIHRGLQVIADDACQKNTDGDTTKIYSDDEDIKEILEDLFHERLNLNKELWSIIFGTCKLGDNFYEIIPDDYVHPTQISRIRYLDPRKTNRIEKNGKLAFYTYKTEIDSNDYTGPEVNYSDDKSKTKEVIYRLQPWQIIHFRIADKDFYPYGGSLLKAGVKTYRRYSMLEDAMMIYRLARVPERRVFKIDIGNLSTSEGMRAVNKIADNYRSKQVMDDKGRINKQAAALSLTQDIFIPVREGATGTEITSLAPGQALNNIDDIKFFRDELLWTLNIPPEYLGTTSDGGNSMAGKGSLAMQDVKFARFVERIQYYIEEGLTKIASIELFFKKKRKEDLKNFKVELTPPSNVKELMDIEYLNQKMQLISAMLATNLFTKDFILKYVMKMSKKEISDINLYKEIETQQNPNADMSGGMGMGGGMDMSGGMGGGMPAQQPMMSVKTEEINPEKMVSIFGKDILIEHKEDYAKLMKAVDEYNANKKKEDDRQKLEEEMNNKMTDSEFIEKAKGIFEKEKQYKNEESVSLYYENEFGGLDFDKETFKVYGKGKKRSGPSSKNSPRIIIEEFERKLK